MSHPNRSKKSHNKSPTPSEVKSAREAIQYRRGLNITEGQTYCAKLICTGVRSWIRYEEGDRTMHPAFWHLFNIRKDES